MNATMLMEAYLSTEGIQTFMNEVEADMGGFFRKILREHASEPKQLYHYTSIEGLVGILTTRKFFLSDMLASADQSEIRYGLDVVREVLEEHKENRMAMSFRKAFPKTDELWWGVGRHFFEHAVCFCSAGDALTQWRGYSSAGGAAISVNFDQLKLRVDRGEFLLGPMFYKKAIQRTLVSRILTRGGEHLHRLALIEAPEKERVRLGDDLLLRVGELLLNVALFFKHPAFDSEQEWRVFKVETADDLSSLKFRTRGGTITPYVELEFEPSLITGIRCSPGTWSRSARYAIERLAKSVGEVRVTQSDLPL